MGYMRVMQQNLFLLALVNGKPELTSSDLADLNAFLKNYNVLNYMYVK